MSEPSLIDRAVQNNGAQKSPEIRPPDAVPRNVTGTISPEMIPAAYESNLAERARRDVAAARSALEAFAVFEAAVLNDPTLSPDARKLSIYDAKGKATDRALDILGKAVDAVDEAERTAVSELSRAAAPRHRGKYDQEIRGHVSGLSPADRVKFLHGRTEAGDTDAVLALLEAPAFLSGVDELPAEMRTTLLERVRRQAAPEAAVVVDEAREIQRRVKAAWTAAMAMIPRHDLRLEGLRDRATRRAVAGAALGVR